MSSTQKPTHKGCSGISGEWNISDASVGTEELGHLEMIGAIVHQLTRNLTDEQIKTAGFDTYFVDRTTGVYPTAASGFPYSAASMACKGDLIADLTEDLAADGAMVEVQHGRKPLKTSSPEATSGRCCPRRNRTFSVWARRWPNGAVKTEYKSETVRQWQAVSFEGRDRQWQPPALCLCT